MTDTDVALEQLQQMLSSEGITSESTPEQEKYKEKSESYSEKSELSDFEKEQQSKGWNPGGSKSAQQWAEDGDLLVQIRVSREENKQLKQTLDSLVDYVKKQEKIVYDKALTDISAQRKQAILNKDVQAVEDLDKQKQELEKSAITPNSPAAQEFRNRYAYLRSDTSFEAMEIQDWLENHDAILAKRKLPANEHVQLLEEHLHKKFPNYFKETKEESDPVESGTSVTETATSSKKHFTYHNLNSTQKKVWKQLERGGTLTLDDYIKQLINFGDLK